MVGCCIEGAGDWSSYPSYWCVITAYSGHKCYTFAYTPSGCLAPPIDLWVAQGVISRHKEIFFPNHFFSSPSANQIACALASSKPHYDLQQGRYQKCYPTVHTSAYIPAGCFVSPMRLWAGQGMISRQKEIFTPTPTF